MSATQGDTRGPSGSSDARLYNDLLSIVSSLCGNSVSFSVRIFLFCLFVTPQIKFKKRNKKALLLT